MLVNAQDRMMRWVSAILLGCVIAWLNWIVVHSLAENVTRAGKTARVSSFVSSETVLDLMPIPLSLGEQSALNSAENKLGVAEAIISTVSPSTVASQEPLSTKDPSSVVEDHPGDQAKADHPPTQDAERSAELPKFFVPNKKHRKKE